MPIRTPHAAPLGEVRYSQHLEVAEHVRMVDCAGSCAAHLELIDDAGWVYAVAPLDAELLRFLRDEINRRLGPRPVDLQPARRSGE